MFYFSLAETLGMPVGEMLQRMSSKELTEWMAFNRVRSVEHGNERQQAEQEIRVRKGTH